MLGCTSCTEARDDRAQEPLITAPRLGRKRCNRGERVLARWRFEGRVKRGRRGNDDRGLTIWICCEVDRGAIHHEPPVTNMCLLTRERRVLVANALVALTAEVEREEMTHEATGAVREIREMRGGLLRIGAFDRRAKPRGEIAKGDELVCVHGWMGHVMPDWCSLTNRA